MDVSGGRQGGVRGEPGGCWRGVKAASGVPNTYVPPPPLRKHPESHQNDGNTGSRA